MKRDMDLCRVLLFEIEASDNVSGLLDFGITGFSDIEVSYHVKLLHEAGLVEAHDASGIGKDGFRWYPVCLTWHGHEFLDAARDDTRWNKAKAYVLENAGGLAFEFLKQYLLKSAAL